MIKVLHSKCKWILLWAFFKVFFRISFHIGFVNLIWKMFVQYILHLGNKKFQMKSSKLTTLEKLDLVCDIMNLIISIISCCFYSFWILEIFSLNFVIKRAYIIQNIAGTKKIFQQTLFNTLSTTTVNWNNKIYFK